MIRRGLTGTQHTFGNARVGVMVVFEDERGKTLRLLVEGKDLVELNEGQTQDLGDGKLTVVEIGLPIAQPPGARPMPGWALLRWEETEPLW